MTSLSSASRSNLDDLESQITRYMNDYRWTKADMKGQKIICSFRIIILSSPSDNSYSAQIFVGSQRQIWQLGRSTAMVRILDNTWDFGYIRGQSMYHDESRFDPLLSLLDFYAYVILGYDFDTYTPGDGTQLFQKAGEIVNKARNSASGGKGWDLPTQSTYSRVGLIDELLSPKFTDLRDAMFRYHFRGLDVLYRDEVKGRKAILGSLEKISILRSRINQFSITIQQFFDTKYLEICDVFLKDPDPNIYATLTKYDPAHQKNYDEYSRKPR